MQFKLKEEEIISFLELKYPERVRIWSFVSWTT